MNTLARLLQVLDIGVVLDVGANKGQYGAGLRNRYQFAGEIHSFEPLSAAFGELATRSAKDARWHAHHMALGSQAGNSAVHVSKNSVSSSLLPVEAWAVAEEPSITYVGSEQIRMQTLDGFLQHTRLPAAAIFLKVDTQGFELEVLRGALGSLGRIPLIQLELSLRPVYEGEPPMEQVMGFLRQIGYTPVEIQNAWGSKTLGAMFQADVLFLRNALYADTLLRQP